ncbi:protein FAR1-RELATED SEQUENCE 5-like [Camellia sinensis]|uniref:protein FAR1-RELATED SEQUENCE 5-like n=1 Tax=Camellia sinensis TaxID=4442 RepID=UPI001036741E|nr:protein FAR1-RELATED SEQUENCE 5-like [Camellia sinensis]
MDIESNNNSFNVSEEVEEHDNNLQFSESGEVEEPKKGMYFTSKQEVYAFYAKYAKQLRFAIAYRTQNVTTDGEVNYFGIECTRAQNRTKRSEVNPLEPSLSSKIDCKARVRASLQKDGRYKLTTVVLKHTDDLIPTDLRHFAMNKRILTRVKRRLEVNNAGGIGVTRNFHSIVVEAGGYEALTFDERDTRNFIQNARRLKLGVGDAELVTLYFHKMQQQNSNFYSAIDLDEDGLIRNLFWADARTRAAYKAFGDKISEKLRRYSQYESIKAALSNAVYDSFTKDEFDEYWKAMIAKFNLNDNEWLGVFYRERHKWIPAYVKDIFWGSM